MFGGRTGETGKVSVRRPTSSFKEVPGLHNSYKLALVDVQLDALDMEIVLSASNSVCNVLDGAEFRRPAGYARAITDVTVSKLCRENHLSAAVEALGVLVQTDCCISKTVFYAVLKKCVGNKDLVLGRRVHAFTVNMGYDKDTFLCNHVLRMYSSHGRLDDAMDVFSVVAEPDAFMWSSIISAHVKHGRDKQAVELYHRMRRSCVKPDAHVFVASLQACARGGDLETGQQVHSDVLASGMEPNLFVFSCLVDMYAKCGSLKDAQRVFDGLHHKNVVTWNAMIGGYSQQGIGDEALRLYSAMQEEGVVAPDSVTFVCLLKACASMGNPSLEKGMQLHAQIRERAYEADVFVASSLVHMYATCDSLEDAQRVFDGVGQKDVVMWTALIAGYSKKGMGQKALRLYSAMQDEGIAVPNSVTFVCLLQACASVGIAALETGKQLHTQIRERGYQGELFVANSLIDMYSKCGSLQDAHSVFDALCYKDVVTWNALIAGYAQRGLGQEALLLYTCMQEEGRAVPDAVTFVSLLQACGSMGTLALEMGKHLHTQIRVRGHQDDVLVVNSLVTMYAKCGSLEDAGRVFDGSHKDVVTWTALIAAYSQQGLGQEALCLYSDMQEGGMAVPDSVTFVCLLQACASVGIPAFKKGKQLHVEIKERGYISDMAVANSVVNMYTKCGSLEDAQRVFDRLSEKTVVTWNTMIAGYYRQGMDQEALDLYRAAEEEILLVPSATTVGYLLQACGNVAALLLGRRLHSQIEVQGLQADLFIAGSLISMYGKCGSLGDAQKVFDQLRDRNIVVWNALVAGYSHQGDSEAVFNLVVRMRNHGIQPDGITFLGVLSVCSHMGLVRKGKLYFEAMSREHSISPTLEHYTCMVDLLGRAGRLNEALDLVKTMSVLPDAAVWHNVLGACRKWSNVQVGLVAFNQAVKLDSKDAAAYVLMAGIYTGAQMWEEAQEIQRRRIGTRAWKQPGKSWWTNMDGVVHSFLAGELGLSRRVGKQETGLRG